MAKKKTTAKRVIQLWIDTGFAGCNHKCIEALPDDWDEMSKEDQDAYLDDAAENFLSNHIACGASVVDASEADVD